MGMTVLKHLERIITTWENELLNLKPDYYNHKNHKCRCLL